jgi:hypothetical protein
MRPALALLLAGIASAAGAQTIEITPLAGFRFGGGNVNTNPHGEFEPGASFELDDSASFGVHVGYQLGGGELELVYARQETQLQWDEPFQGIPVYDLAVEIWQLAGNYYFLDELSRVRPYLGVGLGLTRLLPKPPALTDETRFSASFAGGAKLRLGSHFGLRGEARGFFTVFGSDSDRLCTPATCAGPGLSQLMTQVDLRAGLILAF